MRQDLIVIPAVLFSSTDFAFSDELASCSERRGLLLWLLGGGTARAIGILYSRTEGGLAQVVPGHKEQNDIGKTFPKERCPS